jgi:hypothetical protein
MKTALPFALVAVGALAFAMAGCADPLNVSDPDIVVPGNLNDPTVLPTIRAGAIGDFAFAYSGSGANGSGGTTEGVIMYGGLLADEWLNSETFPTRIEVDGRRIQTTNATMALWFRNLQRARRSAEFSVERYRTLAPDTTTQTGFPEVLALAGYTYIFMAETWCSGVPVSHVLPDGSFEYGRPLTTVELLDTAVVRFDAALAAATVLDTSGASPAARAPKIAARALRINLASVGKARALLDLGQFTQAGAASATVPDIFAYSVEHTENTTRENNGVFNGNVIFERYSVPDGEGVNGIRWRSTADPRTPWERTPTTDVGFDNATPQYDNLRYGDRKAKVTLATGAEARLIRAEAALQLGDTGTGGQFLADLNALRAAPPVYLNSNRSGVAATPVLAALDGASITAAGGAVNLLFNEKARWLWLTSHRLGDLRRLVRQYGRPADSVFPTGAYFKSQIPTYGTDVNFPVPIDEENNPKFDQCLDRNP